MKDFFSRLSGKKKYPFYIQNRTDIIHIHITKTAGTSLVQSMDFNRSKQSYGTKKHYFAKEVINTIGQEHWDKSFKFTFVRNPWDRLYSLYRFRLRKNKIAPEEQGNTFEKWLKQTLSVPNENPYQKPKPQVEWIRNFKQQIDIDFIGRFENLEQDVKKLAKLTDMKIDLPHVNQTLPIIHYSSAYNDELEELVRIYYKEDIDMFNYSFERK